MNDIRSFMAKKVKDVLENLTFEESKEINLEIAKDLPNVLAELMSTDVITDINEEERCRIALQSIYTICAIFDVELSILNRENEHWLSIDRNIARTSIGDKFEIIDQEISEFFEDLNDILREGR